MHIGLVTACYKPVINGVTRMVALYKKYYEAAGHKVSIVTIGDMSGGLAEEGVIHSSGVPLGHTGYYLTPRYTLMAQEIVREVDILHCHHLLMSLEFAARYGQAPIVFTNHTRYDLYTSSYIPVSKPFVSRLYRWFWPLMAQKCDVIIAPSMSIKEILIDYGVKRPIYVIPNGIEFEPYQELSQSIARVELDLPEESSVFIYVGRLAREKNLEHLINEFAMAACLKPSLHLLLVGSGPQAEQLSRLASSLGVLEQIHFVGAVPPEWVPYYLKSADLFVTASQSEVMPLTLLEAMAAGLPILAIDAPGIRDIVCQNVNGILTSAQPGSLAREMKVLAHDTSRLEQLGQQGRRMSKQYSIGRTVEQTLMLYQSLLDERPTGRLSHSVGRDRNNTQNQFQAL